MILGVQHIQMYNYLIEITTQPAKTMVDIIKNRTIITDFIKSLLDSNNVNDFYNPNN